MPTMSDLSSLVQALPKAELHLHVEGGSMYPDLALELAERNGMTLPFHDADSAKDYYAFTSLDQFISILRTTVATLNTAADYHDAILRIGKQQAAANVTYQELFFTPGLRPSVPLKAIVEGLASGREEARSRYGVETRFIADIDRTLPTAGGVAMVDAVHALRDQAAIIGIGLDCQENGFPPSRHAPAFERAAELGFHRTAHAGEDGPPAYVWEALKLCHVERIDHGVRSIEDPGLVRYLAEKQVPLTVCPISNVLLRVFPDMASHSVKRLMDAGCVVTFNSDDPPMFSCDIRDEFRDVSETFQLTTGEVVRVARAGWESSFLEAEEKARYLGEFDQIATDQS